MSLSSDVAQLNILLRGVRSGETAARGSTPLIGVGISSNNNSFTGAELFLDLARSHALGLPTLN